MFTSGGLRIGVLLDQMACKFLAEKKEKNPAPRIFGIKRFDIFKTKEV